MGKVMAWTLLLATVAVYLVMALWSLPKLSSMAGGLTPFDFRPLGYTPEAARAFLAALDDKGRSFYTGVQHRIDLFYPGLLALSMIILVRKLAPGWPGLILCAVAFAGAMFDWAENAVVGKLLATPDPSDDLLSLASRLTVLKSALSTIAMTAILLLLLRAGLRRWRK